MKFFDFETLNKITEEVRKHHPEAELCGMVFIFKGPTDDTAAQPGQCGIVYPYGQTLPHFENMQQSSLITPEPGDPGYFAEWPNPNECGHLRGPC